MMHGPGAAAGPAARAAPRLKSPCLVQRRQRLLIAALQDACCIDQHLWGWRDRREGGSGWPQWPQQACPAVSVRTVVRARWSYSVRYRPAEGRRVCHTGSQEGAPGLQRTEAAPRTVLVAQYAARPPGQPGHAAAAARLHRCVAEGRGQRDADGPGGWGCRGWGRGVASASVCGGRCSCARRPHRRDQRLD